MTFTPDHLLGREFTFWKMEPGRVVRSSVIVAAWDPERGWKLAGRRFSPAWVSDSLLRRLLDEGVLEAA